LRPDARIGKGAHEFNQGVTITCIRGSFAWFFWLQFFNVLRQNGMRQTSPLMMNSMKRFVKQRESNQPP
jgi:hypothetical protein